MNVSSMNQQVSLRPTNCKVTTNDDGQVMVVPNNPDSMSTGQTDLIAETKKKIAELQKQIGEKMGEEGVTGMLKDGAEAVVDKGAETVKQHPFASSAASAGIGFLAGVAFKHFDVPGRVQDAASNAKETLTNTAKDANKKIGQFTKEHPTATGIATEAVKTAAGATLTALITDALIRRRLEGEKQQ